MNLYQNNLERIQEIRRKIKDYSILGKRETCFCCNLKIDSEFFRLESERLTNLLKEIDKLYHFDSVIRKEVELIKENVDLTEIKKEYAILYKKYKDDFDLTNLIIIT